MIINRYEYKGMIKIKKNLLENIIPSGLYNRYRSYKYNLDFKKNICNLRKQDYPCNIQIETLNRCNGECPFCPVNRNVEKRPYQRMTDNLFEQIINELSTERYNGQLALFSNNEPLLDTRILEFAKYARSKLPNAYIYIFTNGTLINTENVLGLVEYLDEIVIDNYNDKLELNDNVKKIDEMCREDDILNEKIKIHLRKINEVLNTRGGSSPNATQKWKRKGGCFLPFGQMVIRPDGKISLCCNDALGEKTLGDLSKNTIKEIWNGEEYRKVRQEVLHDIEKIDLCRYCDAYYYL